MKDVSEVDKGKLNECIKTLNETGLLEAPIRTVGVKVSEKMLAFSKAMVGLSEEEEKFEKVPDELVDFYNEIIGATEDTEGEENGDASDESTSGDGEDSSGEGESTEATEEATGDTSEAKEDSSAVESSDESKKGKKDSKSGKGKEKAKKEPKPKKEKKAPKTKKTVLRDKYGQQVGTQAAKLNEKLFTDIPEKDVLEKAEWFTMDQLASHADTTRARVKSHMHYIENNINFAGKVHVKEVEVKGKKVKTYCATAEFPKKAE